MDKKEVIALVRSDMQKHKDGGIDKMPTVNQYAKIVEMTIKAVEENFRVGLNAEEQAYYYNHENNEN